MQDIQNIPNPDVNSPEGDDDFGRNPNSDVERPEEDVPVPPDVSDAPIEEPPDERDKPPISEDQTEPKHLV